MRDLKLIWDFKGPDAHKIAEHHVIHLKEYVKASQVPVTIMTTEIINELHSIAYLVVREDAMKPIRDALKPHRGQVYQSNLDT
ncbi:MAG: hypothetical protein KC469_02135 [Flavobacteriaceae bacterium]|nr:hypothetical protein [Flavobacteriaceae bacterium]